MLKGMGIKREEKGLKIGCLDILRLKVAAPCNPGTNRRGLFQKKDPIQPAPNLKRTNAAPQVRILQHTCDTVPDCASAAFLLSSLADAVPHDPRQISRTMDRPLP